MNLLSIASHPHDPPLNRLTWLLCWGGLFLVSAVQYRLGLAFASTRMISPLGGWSVHAWMWPLLLLGMLLLPAVAQWAILRVRLRSARLPLGWWLLVTAVTMVLVWCIFWFFTGTAPRQPASMMRGRWLVFSVVQWFSIGALVGVAQASVLVERTTISAWRWVMLSATAWGAGHVAGWLLF